MYAGALVIALTLSGLPPEPAPRPRPPKPWADGVGLLAVGGTLKVLSLAGGITGAAIGGPGDGLSLWSVVPSALGGAMLLGGSYMLARHQGWYRPDDLGHRVRPAKIAGWSLAGAGAALLLGTGVALVLWPYYPIYDDGGVPLYPRAHAAVQSGFLLAPLLIGAGASAAMWSGTYPGWRSRRVELQPTIGGLALRF